MEMMKTIVEIMMGAIAVGSIIYKIAKTEQTLYKHIDDVFDFAKENQLKVSAEITLINYKEAQVEQRLLSLERVSKSHALYLHRLASNNKNDSN
jgi:DhnA family fructose-bisphosphate aldolase class Ia